MTEDAFCKDPQQVEDQMSHILIRLWHLWSRAGYRERSVGLFQALMELNLRAPNFPGSYSSQDKLASFEPFWDSSVPRFGEEKAPGWANVVRNKEINVHSEDMLDIGEDDLIDEFKGKVENAQLWLQLEMLRESKHWLPLRVSPDDDEDEIEDTAR